MHVACHQGRTATAELLIAKGADVEAKDKVRQADKGGWRGVEWACGDSDSHRESGTRRKISRRDEWRDWCGAGDERVVDVGWRQLVAGRLRLGRPTTGLVCCCAADPRRGDWLGGRVLHVPC